VPQIKVDLDAVASGSGGDGNSIRDDAFKRVLMKLLQPVVKPDFSLDPRSVRPATLNVIPNRRHDAILISARRGDGNPNAPSLAKAMLTWHGGPYDTNDICVVVIMTAFGMFVRRRTLGRAAYLTGKDR
jgi:hypothetical protein